ncbi:MAG: TetR/AcrR family transcriptional regulator [Candidatus Izemoplasma sp.]|nr:TetR/AcrR family transcriptional regulator [Candidatus Izemoplasma sp.]
MSDQALTKEERILEAAIIEFAQKGYKKASTNSIVRDAGVSKGLLFHYYISKKELYITVHQHILDVFRNELYDGVNFADRDVFHRLSATTVQKISSYIQHPEFMAFLEKLTQVKEKEIKQRCQIQSEHEQMIIYNKLFSNIDYFLFDEKVNIEKTLNVVRWTIDRISQEWFADNDNQFKEDAFGELEKDIEEYIDLFRDVFYK